MKIKVKVWIGNDNFESKTSICGTDQFPIQNDDICYDIAEMFAKCIKSTHLNGEDVVSYVSTFLKQKTSTAE